MDKKQKSPNHKDPDAPMTLLEAEQFLRKIDEWESVRDMQRDIIINWATFLKKKNTV
jgi:hypothetical protein